MKQRLKGPKRDRAKTITIYPYRVDKNEKFHRATAAKMMTILDDHLDEVGRSALRKERDGTKFVFDELRVHEYLIEMLADDLHAIQTTLGGPIPEKTISVVEVDG